MIISHGFYIIWKIIDISVLRDFINVGFNFKNNIMKTIIVNCKKKNKNVHVNTMLTKLSNVYCINKTKHKRLFRKNESCYGQSKL